MKRGRPLKYRKGAVVGGLTLQSCFYDSTRNKYMWWTTCTCGSCTLIRADVLSKGFCKHCGHAELSRKRKDNKWAAGPNNPKWMADRKERSIQRKVSSYISHQNKKYTLSRDEVRCLVLGDCTYCGQPAFITEEEYGSWPKHLSGIDRVNNELPYTKNNCVSSCWKCNNMKHTLTLEEFLSHVKKISRHNS